MDVHEPGWQRLARSTLAVTGAGVGAAVSTLVHDPILGSMAGQAFAEIGNEFATRVLAPREEQRIATVLVLAAGGVIANQTLGMTLRSDGFFDGDRSDADQIIEGMLLAAKTEHEEKKLPYMANLLARTPFLEGMDVYVLEKLIAEAESTSWLQLQLLAIVHRPKELPLPDVQYSGRASDWNEWAVTQTLTELLDARRLLVFPSSKGAHGQPGFDLRMSSIKLGQLGALLVQTMELTSIPLDELRPLHEELICHAVELTEPSSLE
ncbi:hypothetical protein ACFQ9V_19620 [Leifsonia sp. NPDC056665]|uniref:hypothetical protein n=1 Tax=Leifsonia sp. NPDC056665 TaxID=3345901 RepID=UPI003699791A